jgi:hypothetical protein
MKNVLTPSISHHLMLLDAAKFIWMQSSVVCENETLSELRLQIV